MEAGARFVNNGGRRRHESCLGSSYAKNADMISEFRPDLLALSSYWKVLNVENPEIRYIPHPTTSINERGIFCVL